MQIDVMRIAQTAPHHAGTMPFSNMRSESDLPRLTATDTLDYESGPFTIGTYEIAKAVIIARSDCD
jgi:hypothetical protein